ncbi:DUF262 domain-containing protein, partial [Candidatus Uhrbacteria bacterium]|nr:DUF262 domain-containing protein [Candidatus Uhrbacteria bacterium]
LKKVDKYLDKKSFSIYIKNTNSWYPTSNRALYDAEMLAFSLIQEDTIVVSKNNFIKKLKKLMDDDKFKKSLKKEAGSEQISTRVNSIKGLLINK